MLTFAAPDLADGGTQSGWTNGLGKEATMLRSPIKVLLLAILGMTSVNALANTCGGPLDAQTTQPKARPEFRPDRQEEVKRRLSSESFGAITLGDSIMEGWGPRILQPAFNQPILNSGFGMDGTEQVLWRIQANDWSHQKPQYVLLLVGTDDLRFPVCSVVQGVLADVRAVRGVLPSAKVIVTSILPRGDSMREHDAEIVQINKDLAAAQSEQHFRFFDVHDSFLCNHKTPCALFQPGNLHLTPAGYQLLTDSLHQFLQQN
jgi:lysophospholipase L1-like esterase